MKKLEEIKSMSSFKRESDDFLRKIVGGEYVYAEYYTTTIQGSCYSDRRANTVLDNCETEWDGKERVGDPVECPSTK